MGFRMNAADRMTELGNRILNLAAALLVILLLLMSGYSLWYTWYMYHDSYLSDEIARYKPGEGDESLSLKDLMKLNPDVVAWLTIDDTHIDYPVVQGKDDMEYLNKDALGKFSISGSLFLSCQNDRNFTDNYNIVYGHHMDNGAMFGDMDRFLEDGFLDTHTSGTLELPDRILDIELFACVATDAYDELVYQTPANVKPENVEELAENICKKAKQHRDIHIGNGERLIAFSTCTDATTNGRIVLFGRLDDSRLKREKSDV